MYINILLPLITIYCHKGSEHKIPFCALCWPVEQLHAVQLHHGPRAAASAPLLHWPAAVCASGRKSAAVLPATHLQQVSSLSWRGSSVPWVFNSLVKNVPCKCVRDGCCLFLCFCALKDIHPREALAEEQAGRLAVQEVSWRSLYDLCRIGDVNVLFVADIKMVSCNVFLHFISE